MSSILSALNTANSTLQADQTVIETIDHNVANANTSGYTLQTAHLVAAPPYTVPSMMRAAGPGQIGAGVQVSGIDRSRDVLLDNQYRYQSQYSGQYATLDTQYTQIQGILNEPSTTGLSANLNHFWSSWQALADDPTNSGARASLQQAGMTLASNFNSAAQQLTQAQQQADAAVTTAVTNVNNFATQIANLNSQIRAVKASGQQPNDLMDQRDQLIDQLATAVPIVYSTGSDGAVTINLATQVPGTTTLQIARPSAAPLVSGTATNLLVTNPMGIPTYASTAAGTETMALSGTFTGTIGSKYIVKVTALTAGAVTGASYSNDGGNTWTASVSATSPFTLSNGVNASFTAGAVVGDQFSFTANGTVAASFVSQGAPLVDPLALTPASATTNPIGGQLGAAVQLRDVIIGGATGLLAQLNTIAQAVVQDVNVQHAAGYDLATGATGKPFFNVGPPATPLGAPFTAVGTVTAANIVVDPAIVANPQTIAAASAANSPGDGANAQAISNLRLAVGAAGTPLPGQSIEKAYESMITVLGANAQQAKSADASQAVVMQSLTSQRQSLGGVSMDEQMTMLIQFQHSYAAAARIVTTMDSLLDTIVNHMGLGN